NAAFLASDDGSLVPVPTEAAVARSLWANRNVPVIHVGFAFPTLANGPANPKQNPTIFGPPSWALQTVLDSLPDPDGHWIVAPAGNQNCSIPQYPAAFGPTHRNVVGVGSIDATGARSPFSNYGYGQNKWVKCSAIGRDVVSTFLDDFDGETE